MSKHKVVHNRCRGSFGLSLAAIRLARQLSADERWAQSSLPEDADRQGTRYKPNVCWIDEKHPRHDPVLVQVVETLGVTANGERAELAIVEIEGNRYVIEDAEGIETVQTPDSVKWQIIA